MCMTHRHLLSVEVNICNEWMNRWSHQISKMPLFFNKVINSVVNLSRYFQHETHVCCQVFIDFISIFTVVLIVLSKLDLDWKEEFTFGISKYTEEINVKICFL